MTVADRLQRSARRAAARGIAPVLQARFDAAAAGEMDAVYELRVTGPDAGIEDHFTLAVSDGTLTVTRRPAPGAAAWVAISLRDMLALVEGTVSLWELMAAKRLDLGGEPFTALRFPALFQLGS